MAKKSLERIDEVISEIQDQYGDLAQETTARRGGSLRSALAQRNVYGGLGSLNYTSSDEYRTLINQLEAAQKAGSERLKLEPDGPGSSTLGEFVNFADQINKAIGADIASDFLTAEFDTSTMTPYFFVSDVAGLSEFLAKADQAILDAAGAGKDIKSNLVGQGSIIGGLGEGDVIQQENVEEYVTNVNRQTTEQPQLLPDLGEQLIELKKPKTVDPLSVGSTMPGANTGATMKRI